MVFLRIQRKSMKEDGQENRGHQGMRPIGGGGLARVPNLRVCDHSFSHWEWHTQEEGRAN